MSILTNKRKRAQEDMGDNMPSKGQKKPRRKTKGTVNFAETVHTVFFDEDQTTQSIPKTKPAQFPISPASPYLAESTSGESPEQSGDETSPSAEANTAGRRALIPFSFAPASPDPAESSSEQPSEQPGDEKLFSTEEVDTMRNLAGAALQREEETYRAQMARGFEALRAYGKPRPQSRDGTAYEPEDASQRTGPAGAESIEDRFPNGGSVTELSVLDDRPDRAGGQAGELRRDLAIVGGKKSEVEGLPGKGEYEGDGRRLGGGAAE